MPLRGGRKRPRPQLTPPTHSGRPPPTQSCGTHWAPYINTHPEHSTRAHAPSKPRPPHALGPPHPQGPGSGRLLFLRTAWSPSSTAPCWRTRRARRRKVGVGAARTSAHARWPQGCVSPGTVLAEEQGGRCRVAAPLPRRGPQSPPTGPAWLQAASGPQASVLPSRSGGSSPREKETFWK